MIQGSANLGINTESRAQDRSLVFNGASPLPQFFFFFHVYFACIRLRVLVIMASPRFVVLTGSPGVGKTTIVKNAVKALADQGITVSGFYTTELRENGNRVGFDVVTTYGKRAPLARLREMCPGGKGPFVGKYCVTVHAFEKIALDSLKTKCGVLVIDEVGKMELFSKPFGNRVAELFSDESNCILVTVPVSTGTLCLPLVDQIKSDKCARVLTVNRSNRDHLVNEVLDTLRSAVGK